eukprot:COSAG04_NODE_495_length_13411_cov_35.496094_1_plen_187_part_00
MVAACRRVHRRAPRKRADCAAGSRRPRLRRRPLRHQPQHPRQSAPHPTFGQQTKSRILFADFLDQAPMSPMMSSELHQTSKNEQPKGGPTLASGSKSAGHGDGADGHQRALRRGGHARRLASACAQGEARRATRSWIEQGRRERQSPSNTNCGVHRIQRTREFPSAVAKCHARPPKMAPSLIDHWN